MGNRGGALSAMAKLLARIKALFAPPQSAAPPREADVTAAPATPAAPPEPVAVRLAEPAAVVLDEPAPAETLPVEPEQVAAVAEGAPVLAAEASADGLTLRLETERGSPSTFQVTKSGATIGRGPESTIQLADLSVSRKHARIAYRQGAYWLSDLGSMGGTWVDGTKLAAPRRVATGQTIDIGLCRLVVVAAAEGEKTGAAKGPSNAA